MTPPLPPQPRLLQRLKRAWHRWRTLPTRLDALEASTHQRLDWLTQNHQASVARLDWLTQNHQASVAWLQTTYPEIVAAIGRKIEHDALQQLSEQLFTALYRELASQRDATVPVARTNDAAPPPTVVPHAPDQAAAHAFYVALERHFRGTQAELQQRLQPYLPKVLGDPSLPDGPIVDLGCGRGEWLALLQQHRRNALGVDLNPINAAVCRQAGLHVVTDDAEHFLRHQPPDSVGAVTAFQLIEHLPFALLQTILEHIYRALQPDGLLLLETPNPENLQVACHTFWLDPTHQRPLPPALMHFLLQRQGFERIEIMRLNPLPAPADCATLPDWLVALLFGPRDYAIIARKPRHG